MAYQFVANPRNGDSDQGSFGFGPAPDCLAACCCETISAVPGETNSVLVNYTGWVAPLGGRGLCAPTSITVALLTPNETPANPLPLTVPSERVFIKNGNLLYFALVADPSATIGDVYRITVTQSAMTCDAEFFKHISCYDVTISKC